MKRASALIAIGVTIASFASPAEAYKVFVSNEKGNSISVLDSDTMEVVKTIKVGQRPRGIAISNDGKFIFVCASDDDTIQIIDAVLAEVIGRNIRDDRHSCPLRGQTAPQYSAARGFQNRGLHARVAQHCARTDWTGVVAALDLLAGDE